MSDNNALRVLFVEDSEDDKELLVSALRSEYAHIEHRRVESVASLRAALAEGWWDAILCDHNLPALDAPSALRIVQETHKDTPFIIVSALIDDATTAAAMMAGAADMISKDNLSRLLPVIKRELQKSSTILDLMRAREHCHQIAYYEPLSGLPNREYLAREVNRRLEGRSCAGKLALIVINLSRFLLIPRTLGVDAANQTLRLTGERIRACVGDAGLVASFGGDRYAVLLDGYPDDGIAMGIIDTINEEISKPLTVAGQELFLAKRIGISLYPEDGQDFHKLAISAEIAMNQVRPDEGCSYKFFDPGMNAVSRDQLTLEHALRRAIQQNEFLLHYQPQFDLLSGKIAGVEALLRWRLPDGSVVSPAEFIPVLEETGLIVPVGEWVLKTACMQRLQWQKAGFPPVRVAVNLSAIQFRQTELVAMVRRVLDESGLDCRFLELEITENIAMHNEETVISTLSELRDMGISLAIDDFGTGYSSLSYLRQFPVHKLKIDRSFVNDIATSDNGDSIVKAIVALAQNLNLSVIAEGVETEQQAAFLRSCGCFEVQGFLFSPAVSAEKIAGIAAFQLTQTRASH